MMVFFIRIYLFALFLVQESTSKKTKAEKSKFFLSEDELEWEEGKKVNKCRD